MNTLKVKKLHPDAILPTRAHPHDAGLDLYANETVYIGRNTKLVPTGVSVCIPTGFVGIIADRSSLAYLGLKVMGGVIDSGFTGELKVVMGYLSTGIGSVEKGVKVAQLLIIPIVTPTVQEVAELEDTERGSNGFGSSGA